jgi:hypothetical protein
MRKLITLSSTALLAALATLSASVTHAQVVTVPTTPQIGSSNPATAQPLVPRPNTKPCVVQLFTNLLFADFTPKVFNYTPPSNCAGPWAKVVFTADFTVTAGRQFDRTAAFYLGHASIYYGTTAEPRATLSPSWHVESDVTDLSAIFKSPQTGEANLGNFVGVSGGVTYNGLIYANAALEFYPASFRDPAPRVPDIVVPVNGTGGDAGTLNTTSDQITQTLDLPTNVEKVYLDVIAQSQSNDEFWYFCVPNDQTSNLESCGNTAFRETEISIDGKPAGVAPVYPWIYTGGIDPGFWEPIPGNQTLDFKPYRVDLTPFAGLLGDGGTHSVAVSVFNANSYFLATANLLVFTDHGSAKDVGGVISNTLSAAPTPFVKENIKTNPSGPTYTGNVLVGSNRDFTIKGWLNTSHGRVVTTVRQTVNFLSNQQFNVSPTVEIQNADQSSTVDSEATTQDGPFLSTKQQHFSYPLKIDYKFVANTDGTFTQTASVNQQFLRDTAEGGFGSPFFASSVNEQTKAQDTLELSPSFSITAFVNPSSSQSYRYQNSRGGCYSRTITSSNLVLTGVSNGHGCH